MIWILFICGVILMVSSLGYLYLGHHSVGWPTTSAKILFSMLQERQVHSRTVYQPRLVYEYVVNGVARQSDKIGFYAATEGKEWAERLLAARPEGAEVVVYYYPRLPNIAVLDPGTKQVWVWATLSAVAGLIALSSGVVLFNDNPNALVDALFGLVSKMLP